MKIIKLRTPTATSYLDESLKVTSLNPVLAYDKKNHFFVLDEMGITQ